MKLTQTRRHGTVMAVAVTALCSLVGVHNASADPQQQALSPTSARPAATIPFDPPVVHPGWGPHVETFKRQPLQGRAQVSYGRDLMFREGDRKSFKVLHPFLLRPPKTVLVQKKPQAESQVGPRPKQK